MNSFILGFVLGLLVTPVISGLIFMLILLPRSAPAPGDFAETAESWAERSFNDANKN